VSLHDKQVRASLLQTRAQVAPQSRKADTLYWNLCSFCLHRVDLDPENRPLTHEYLRLTRS